MEEKHLISKLQDGDREAFSILVARYSSKIYNVCLSILQNQGDAEDMVQEVFTEVYRSVKTFKEQSSLGTWIYRIANNKCLDELRKRNRKKRFAWLDSLSNPDNAHKSDRISDFEHPGIQMERKEMARYLFKAIDQLPERQRIAYTLHKVEGLSYAEITEILDTTLASVEALMHRARLNLQKTLSHYYDTL